MALITSYADTIIFFVTNVLIYAKYRRLLIAYLIFFRRFPNIAKPTKLSEMVQWRKCFDKNPIFCGFADKLLVKEWVSGEFANLAIPKTIWVGTRPEEIPEKYLKNNFVLKTNHASGTNYFPYRERYSRADVERIFRRWLSIDWSKYYSEWAYSSVKRRIFVEELVGDKNNLFDISVRAHNGDVSIASVAINWKMENQQYGYYLPDGSRYDDEFDFLSVPTKYKLNRDFVVPKPFFEALDAAKILSRGLDYIRVDFLASENNLFFSEMTVYPASGLSSDGPFSEIIIRDWIKNIDQSWFFKTRHSWFRNIYQARVMRYFMSLR
jgi:TupA-like ATPgrasp